MRGLVVSYMAPPEAQRRFGLSFASRALALGEGLLMIGHRKVTTTARYAHLARDTERASAVKVGRSIGADILGLSSEQDRAA